MNHIEVTNNQSHFVLANNYYQSGNYQDAIISYKQRINTDEMNDDVWYSYYQIGKCYKIWTILLMRCIIG